MGGIAEIISKYGFPMVMAVGMGFIIRMVWDWATKEVKPVITDANTVLIALIDRWEHWLTFKEIRDFLENKQLSQHPGILTATEVDNVLKIAKNLHQQQVNNQQN